MISPHRLEYPVKVPILPGLPSVRLKILNRASREIEIIYPNDGVYDDDCNSYLMDLEEAPTILKNLGCTRAHEAIDFLWNFKYVEVDLTDSTYKRLPLPPEPMTKDIVIINGVPIDTSVHNIPL